MSSPAHPFDLPKDWERYQFEHAAPARRLLQTHISWVILTGEWAYKFKKPVRFDFLDYSTLERRLHFCRLELERNRIWAAEIYDGLTAVVSDGERFRVCAWPAALAAGEQVVEYAVRMREFPQTALLAAQLQAGRISLERIEDLASRVADLQRQFDVVELTADAARNGAIEPARENFAYLLEHSPVGVDRDAVEALADWTQQEIGRWRDAFVARARDGFVRRGHGDLHLNNLVYWHERILPFDGIEFNPQLSDIDTQNEIAFLHMELSEHGYPAHAHRFLNRYLEASGDYAGLGLLRFYLVYRAMVRAKIDLIRSVQTGCAGDPASANAGDAAAVGFSEEGRRYLRYAHATIAPRPLQLVITFGVSGSGKSTRALQWIEQAGCVRLRSDVIRKQLAGRDPLEKTAAAELPSLYSRDSTVATYERLAELAEQIVRAGYRVIVDATFLRKSERERFRHLAERLDAEFRIVACSAPPEELARRLQARGADPSDADLSVLRRQLQAVDPLEEDELTFVAVAPPSSPEA